MEKVFTRYLLMKGICDDMCMDIVVLIIQYYRIIIDRKIISAIKNGLTVNKGGVTHLWNDDGDLAITRFGFDCDMKYIISRRRFIVFMGYDNNMYVDRWRTKYNYGGNYGGNKGGNKVVESSKDVLFVADVMEVKCASDDIFVFKNNRLFQYYQTSKSIWMVKDLNIDGIRDFYVMNGYIFVLKKIGLMGYDINNKAEHLHFDGIIDISCSSGHCMVLTNEGLYGFGYNFEGQLGIDGPRRFEYFVKIRTLPFMLNSIRELYCDGYQSFVVTDNGIFACGDLKSVVDADSYRKYSFIKLNISQFEEISCFENNIVILTKQGLIINDRYITKYYNNNFL